jgi:hypothetical protein
MATGALDANGIWIYGEDDSETTFSALLNKLGDSVSDQLATGRVLQAQSFTYSTQVSTTSTTFVTTGLSGTITPKKTTSKILILAHTTGQKASDFVQTMFTIYRGTVSGTNLGTAAGMINLFVDGTGANRIWAGVSVNFLDSPNTTSAQTYTLAMRTGGATAPAAAQVQNSLASMVLLEIAG